MLTKIKKTLSRVKYTIAIEDEIALCVTDDIILASLPTSMSYFTFLNVLLQGNPHAKRGLNFPILFVFNACAF